MKIKFAYGYKIYTLLLNREFFRKPDQKES